MGQFVKLTHYPAMKDEAVFEFLLRACGGRRQPRALMEVCDPRVSHGEGRYVYDAAGLVDRAFGYISKMRSKVMIRSTGLSPSAIADAIERVLRDAAGEKASVAREVDAQEVIWVTLTPHNSASAPVEVRIDGPNVLVTIGGGATFDFPYWSGRSIFDVECLTEVGDLVLAVVRGEVCEWGDVEDLQLARHSGASIGVGSSRVETGRHPLSSRPWRKRQKFIRTYEPYH